MSVKPIDLQTHISQIHEVAKGEQGRSAAVIDGQHNMEKTSGEKSKLVSERLDENKKAEKAAIKREERRRKRKKRKLKAQVADEQNIEEEQVIRDEKIGRVIDVRR